MKLLKKYIQYLRLLRYCKRQYKSYEMGVIVEALIFGSPREMVRGELFWYRRYRMIKTLWRRNCIIYLFEVVNQ